MNEGELKMYHPWFKDIAIFITMAAILLIANRYVGVIKDYKESTVMIRSWEACSLGKGVIITPVGNTECGQ